MPVPPLDHMTLRTAGLQSALGATFGKVRNWNSQRRAYDRFHQGWDLEASIGTPCRAVADGMIEYIGFHVQYGHQVILRFSKSGIRRQTLPGDTLFAQYAHLLPTVPVSVGQNVRAGTVIAYTGISGNASPHAPHLHFEVRTTADPNPTKGARGRVDPATVLGYHYLQCE